MWPLALVAAILLMGLAQGCGIRGKVVVSSRSAMPVESRENPTPYDGMVDQSAIVAYEFGLCETDLDCSTSAGFCSTAELPASDLRGPVSECLERVPAEHCACVEGACRWRRVAPTMQCAVLAEQVLGLGVRGFDGLSADEEYPVRLWDHGN